MTNKTRAELAALIQSIYEEGYDVGDWARIVDGLLAEIGYEPAPEPPTYTEGTIARVTDEGGYTHVAEWVSRAWIRTKDSRGSAWGGIHRHVSVEVIPTYDPSRELVIPLDKVPGSLGLRYCAGILDAIDQIDVLYFLRLVADLAEQARNRGE